METSRLFEVLKGKTMVSGGEVTLSHSIGGGWEASVEIIMARVSYLNISWAPLSVPAYHSRGGLRSVTELRGNLTYSS